MAIVARAEADSGGGKKELEIIERKRIFSVRVQDAIRDQKWTGI